MHLGHATFIWADMAMGGYGTERRTRTRVKSMNSGWESEAVRDAFNKDRRSTRDHKGTAAVNDGKTLFPSKIKELGGTLLLYLQTTADIVLLLSAAQHTLLHQHACARWQPCPAQFAGAHGVVISSCCSCRP